MLKNEMEDFILKEDIFEEVQLSSGPGGLAHRSFGLEKPVRRR